MRFSFSFLIGAGAVLGHLYLYGRLVRHLAPSTRWRFGLGGLLAAMTLLLMARRPLRDAGGWIEAVYEVVAYGWMAIALCMVTATALGDLVRLGVALRRAWSRRGAKDLNGREGSRSAPPTGAPVQVARRDFLVRGLPGTVVAGGGIMAGYGITRAFTPAEVTERAVHLAKLPPTLDGLTVVQLTDIHVGPFIGRRFIDRLVEQANELRPDVLVITGDLVDGSVPELGRAVAGLAELRARFGTYFVTGNHDYYSGDEAWVRFLEQHGLQVLRNRRVPIGDAGGSFDLVGVDDWSGGRRRGKRGYDLQAALAGRDPDRAAVLLAHQPANFEVAASAGIDLQISGHTHGGQIFPMTELIGLGWKYNRGLYRHGDGQIYVSRGCGFWGPPARIRSAPEIAKLTLTTRES